jgi:hypothetical protein
MTCTQVDVCNTKINSLWGVGSAWGTALVFTIHIYDAQFARNGSHFSWNLQ